MSGTRVLAWNLLHGGGERLERLAAAIAAHEPDVVALAEYRVATGPRLAALLAGHGLALAGTTEPPPRKNGMALFARRRVELAPPDTDAVLAQRRLAAALPDAGFALLALHIPPKISIGVEGKQRFWDRLLEDARRALETPMLIVGDLNTGAPYRDEPRASLYCADSFVALGELGWVDLWRRFHGPDRREWSWIWPSFRARASEGRRVPGYRLDHAFATPALAERATACRYSHAERDAGLSDHSILVVDLDGEA